MKRLPELKFLSIFAFVLLATSVAEGRDTADFNYNYGNSVKTDTTGTTRLLNITRFMLDIIPPSSGVQFYKDRVVYLSLSKNERKMTSNQISFGAVEAYSGYIADSVLNNRRIFSQTTAFSYPCEGMTFNQNYDTVYYTRIPEKDKKEKIFMAGITSDSKNLTTLVSGNTPLDFCLDNFSYSHPALSADGKFMVFASDRTGSLGGMDLFVTRKKGNSWSSPENLGESVNTTGNEYYPFLDNENNLYFSSDRLPGFGGYDIFTCRYNGRGWDKPVNLSAGINSDNDDIAFTINKVDEQSAFFTRRFRSGKAESQLFRITFRQKSDAVNLLTISQLFNGKQVSPAGSDLALNTSQKVAPVTEQQVNKTVTESGKKEEKRTADSSLYFKKKSEQKTLAAVEKPVVPSGKAEQKKVVIPERTITPPENKEAAKPAYKPGQTESKEGVIYRVQLLPSASQIKAGEVTINGKNYKISEYKYLGAVRYTVGEFTSLPPAASLQNLCRQAGYPQSFVAAFKNNERSLDPNLFK